MQLAELRAKGVAPRLRVLEGEQKPVANFDGKEVINLASNNYLGLTTHKALRKAAIEAVRKYGAGAGAVRTIAGTMKLHMELEAADRAIQECRGLRGVSVGIHGERGNGVGGFRQGRLDYFG